MNHSDWRHTQCPIFSAPLILNYALWAELATVWSFVAAVVVYNNNSVYYDLCTFHYSTVYVVLLYHLPGCNPQRRGESPNELF